VVAEEGEEAAAEGDVVAVGDEMRNSMKSRLSELPSLGIGIGFRQPFLSDLFLHQQEIDFLEIVADHYLDASSEKLQELDLLASHFPIIPHALDLSLGSAEGIDERYLDQLAELIDRLQPAWWSEHIAFTRAGGVPIGHLAPLPATRESLEVIHRNIETVRRRIDTPLILENITYQITFPFSEMNQAAFVTEILQENDCGMLLDVTNLLTNATNHNFDVIDFFEDLPMERIVQLHFAGGHWHNGVLVDSHSQPAPPQVWDLLETVLQQVPVKGIILERDTNLPPLRDLIDELKRLRRIAEAHCQWD